MSRTDIYNRVQLYSEYTNIKYPVDDECVEPIPFHFMVDAAVSVPEGLADVRITNIVRAPAYVFMSLEAGEEPVGHLFVAGPAAFRIYPLTMTAAGAGWVMFGPGINEQLDLRGISAPLDRRCVVPAVGGGRQLRLRVNGIEHPMPNILTVRTNYFATATVEDRTYDTEPAGAGTETAASAVIGRNDVVLSEDLLKYGLVDNDFTDLPLFTINQLPPDEYGNFTLAIDDIVGSSSSGSSDSSMMGGAIVPITSPTGVTDEIGLLVLTRDSVEGCPDPYRDLRAKIKKGKEGYGTAYDLPLDPFVGDWYLPWP